MRKRGWNKKIRPVIERGGGMTAPAPALAIEGGHVVIRLPDDVRDDLAASLAPCPCVAAKSTATEDARQWLLGALSDPPVRVPLHQVHGLRVVLADCPCRGPQPGNTIRHRLSAALGKVRT